MNSRQSVPEMGKGKGKGKIKRKKFGGRVENGDCVRKRVKVRERERKRKSVCAYVCTCVTWRDWCVRVRHDVNGVDISGYFTELYKRGPFRTNRSTNIGCLRIGPAYVD